MMAGLGASLLKWWRTASTRSRWTAGILLFSLLSTGVLMLIPDSSAAGGLYASSAVDSTPWYILGVFVKLLVVIGLFIGSVIVFRFYSKKQPFRKTPQQLAVVETVRLSPRQAMHIVRAGGRLLLIGATDQTISLITEMEASEQALEKEAPSEQEMPFAAVLADIGSQGWKPRAKETKPS